VRYISQFLNQRLWTAAASEERRISDFARIALAAPSNVIKGIKLSNNRAEILLQKLLARRMIEW
jgi:hypothetical protein